MWAEVGHHLLLASAESPAVGKRRHAGRDFDRTSTSVVEDAILECPSVNVPHPAGNWAVDDGGPPEQEDHQRNDSASFRGGSSRDSSSDSAELHLYKDIVSRAVVYVKRFQAW